MEERTYVYKQTDDFTVSIQEAGGFVFLLLEVDHWAPSVFKELQALFVDVCVEFADKGHDLLFSSMDNTKTLKMCEMVHPLYEIKELDHYGDIYWVVAWETGLEI